MRPDRRAMLKMTVAWPLGAGLATMLPACQEVAGEAPKAIKYGRDMCDHCTMLISEPQFAAQVWNPATKRYGLFDDIGCAAVFMEENGLVDKPGVRFWVADADDPKAWLDAATAFYRTGARTPMDYGFAATRTAAPDRIPFDRMRSKALEKAHCTPRSGAPTT